MAKAPSSQDYEAALAAIAEPKIWVSARAMAWESNGNQLPGYKLRAPLAFAQHPSIQIEGLFVDAYYKDSTIPGVPPKLSIVLMHRNTRVLAIDTNGPSTHFNSVGIGLPYHMQRIDHPHLHLVARDALEGYAEPLAVDSSAGHWNDLMRRASITGYPDFRAPAGQMAMPI